MTFNFWLMLEASFYSTFRIIFISFAGYLLVRFQIIEKPIIRGIAGLTANFLIPCLSISEICKSFHIEDVSMWLPILVCCVLSVAIGYLTGIISCKIIKPTNNEIYRLILIVFMFSNSTSMQLIYVDSLSGILGILMSGSNMANASDCQTNQESARAIAKSQGYMIVLLYTIFVTFLRWSIGYNLMKPDPFIQPLRDDLEFSSNKSVEEVQAKKEKDANEKSPTNENGNVQFQELKIVSRVAISEPVQSKFSWILKCLKEGINMPFISGFLAIFLTLVPYVGTYISTKDSVLYKLIVESCSAVGSSVSTVVILLLGLNLSLSLRESFHGESISSKLIILVIVIKSTVIPLLGLVLIYYIGYTTGLLNNPLQCFLLLTNFCTPTAINMITIAIVNQFQVNNLSKMLIYQYLIGILTVTLWTAVYLSLFI